MKEDIVLQAKYVLGADGANSTVRRLLCLTFDGFSYPWESECHCSQPCYGRTFASDAETDR